MYYDSTSSKRGKIEHDFFNGSSWWGMTINLIFHRVSFDGHIEPYQYWAAAVTTISIEFNKK